MDFFLYPINLRIAGETAVVVGAGEVAYRKTLRLLECGASVRVVAPKLCPPMSELLKAGRIDCRRRKFRPGDVRGAKIVISATNDRRVNASVVSEARSLGALVNVVDEPDLSDFFVPSVVRRGHLTMTVSTEGRCPAVSKMMRRKLERAFGPEYAEYLSLMEDARKRIQKEFPDDEPMRAEAMQAVLELPILELVRRGELEKARREVMECILRL